jgi:hypothetical protein
VVFGHCDSRLAERRFRDNGLRRLALAAGRRDQKNYE